MHSNSKHPAGSVTRTTKITEPWNDSDHSHFLLLTLPHIFLRVVSELTVRTVQNKGGEKERSR